jgi:hypothetical protein
LSEAKRDLDPQSSHPQATSNILHTAPGSFRPPFNNDHSHPLPMTYPSPADSRRTSDERPGLFPRPSGQTLPPVRDLINEDKAPQPQEHPGAFRPLNATSEHSKYAADSRYPSDPRAPLQQSFGPPPSAPIPYGSSSYQSTVPVSGLSHDAALPAPAPALHINTKMDTKSQGMHGQTSDLCSDDCALHDRSNSSSIAYASPSFASTTSYGQPSVSAHYPSSYPQTTSHPYTTTMAPTTSAQYQPTAYVRSPPFPAPAQFSAPYEDGVTSSRVEERIAMGRPAGSGMGESVKRRLDEFGIEHGIIEVWF